MSLISKYCKLLLCCLMVTGRHLFAQIDLPAPVIDSNQLALELMKEQRKKWGPNDTINLPAILYQNEIVNYKEQEMAWVSNLSPAKLAKFIEEWTRLKMPSTLLILMQELPGLPLMI